MHKFNIRRGLRLLLVAGLCLGTLATTGAVSQSEDSPRLSSGLRLSPELQEGIREIRPPVAPVVEFQTETAAPLREEEGTDRTEAEARQEQAAALLARTELTREQKDALAGRAGTDTLLFRLLELGNLTHEDLVCLALPNSRADRLDRYRAWAAAHPDDAAETVVLQVNIDRDQDFYSLIWEVADPSDLTVLVNKHYALPAGYVPELEALGSRYGSGSLRPEAARAFRTMADAARADGISLRSVSAYRSYATQKSIYNRYLKQYKQSTVDTFSARPGHSEHQTGLALDINVASSSAHFERTPAFAWLKEHCAEYGFILRYDQGKEDITGYRFEPWHYRYVGTEIAKVCMEQGITYEEYLALLPQ